MPPAQPIRTFISYSRDSAAHDEKVLRFADRLCSRGIDCILDQYFTSPSEGWPKWMDRELQKAVYVLVVCTEGYNEKLRGENPRGSGKGVKWESLVTYQMLYEAGSENSNVIP